jgi:hypothetical protein
MLFYSAYVLTYNVRALMLWKHEEEAIKRTTKKACMDGLVNFAVITTQQIVHGTLPA